MVILESICAEPIIYIEEVVENLNLNGKRKIRVKGPGRVVKLPQQVFWQYEYC